MAWRPVFMTMLLGGLSACTGGALDPPALPDSSHFVPPAVTLPQAEAAASRTIEDTLAQIRAAREALTHAPLVQVPPQEAVGTRVEKPPPERKGPRRASDPIAQAEQGSLLTANRASFAENTSAILRYPYKIGAVYEIITSPAHATVLLLPPGLQRAVPLVLDPEKFDVGVAEMGAEPDDWRQEAIILRAVTAGLEVTTPLLTKSGHLFMLRIKSREEKAMLAVTWELPLMHVITGDLRPGRESQAPIPSPKIDLARLHTQYRIEPGKQPVSWTPVEAYDDAKVTVVRFAEDLGYTTAPVLMAVTLDGKTTLPLEYLTYQVPDHPEKGLFYVTKGIYPRLRLLDGQQGRVDIVRLPAPDPAYVEQSHAPR
jgi:type IV secretory pathway VirB9-like protein